MQPSRGRVGHSMAILGSSVFVIGGHVDGSFLGDVFAFDLNKLGEAGIGWEDMAELPTPRTNHTTVSYNQMLYV